MQQTETLAQPAELNTTPNTWDQERPVKQLRSFVLDRLNINKEEINTDSALKYKKEIYNLTKENSSDEHWLKRLLNKFIEFCRNVYYRVVEYATKLGIAITRQEVAATRLATYISDNLDNFKIDKWEYMIPYADIIGNFTILKNFTVGEIEKYVKTDPEHIKLFIMPRERGKKYFSVQRASQNRLNLLSHASGDFFCTLDGDDFYCDSEFLMEVKKWLIH